jgi:hypothetical protein
VELPEEFGLAGYCGKLLRWLYGMRKAAQGWEQHYSMTLVSSGFVQGTSAPTVFYHPVCGTRCVVHGDDFTFMGEELALKKWKVLMSDWYDIKFRGILGPDAHDIKEIVILGRLLRWVGNGVEYEADPKHRQLLMKNEGMNETSKSVVSPLVKTVDTEEEKEKLDKVGQKKFRGGAARANFLGLDRPDTQFATKEACRGMANPSIGDVAKIKRMVRYLIGAPKLIWKHTVERDEEAV